MKKLLSGVLSVALVLPYCIPARAAPASTEGRFEPSVTYNVSVTPEERTEIHAQVDAISGDVGDMEVGDGSYDPLTLVGGLATGSDYDSISQGKGAAGSVPTEYPFYVPNTEANRNEHDRKTDKLNWVEQLAKDLGFPVVVHRQEDKYVYVEIGDPDAPEMVMALSHLDSPPMAIDAAHLELWRDAKGNIGTTVGPDGFYHKPYVRDGWLYGTGVQDDSGPTLATLFAAKALMEAGLPMDRRIRIVMGAYEDNSPGVPKVEDTLNYMDIPYYTSNPGFYDNWAYKSLNREETPIAGYTSDSRFPVVVGNTPTPRNADKSLAYPVISMDLGKDTGKPFSLGAAGAGVTLRAGDPTLKDIVTGSTTQVASRAVFMLDVEGVSAEAKDSFISSVEAAATQRGWLPTPSGETPKVSLTYQIASDTQVIYAIENDTSVYMTGRDTLILEVNTDVAMEMPMPQYGKNAIVWGMYLLSEAYEANGIDLQVTKAADGITDLFFRGCVEGEAYIGRYMGIPEDLLRNPDSGVANVTLALMGGIDKEGLTSFCKETSLSIPLYVRYMYTNEADYNTAMSAVVQAWHEKGFAWKDSKYAEGELRPFSNPTLYLTHDNLLNALQMASYRATMQHDPEAFSDVYDLLDISYPVGTTGGTLAGNYFNKMNAFGAVIPGNERWWHAANERIKVDSIVEMTKMMADGMLEMARYSGPAGAQLMWADIPDLNADRSDLDLLDVTIGTYQDASSAVQSSYLGSDVLLGATKFNIPMWAERGNTSKSAAQFALGHEKGGVYLSTDNADFLANTFVMPMRLEFKVAKPEDMSQSRWQRVMNGGYRDLNFNIVKDGTVIPLTVPQGEDPDQYFSTRVSQYDPDTLYVSVNLAITDGEYTGVSTVLADSKTDLYQLNAEYEAAHGNPFPERGAVQERGFFLFGDGSKDAEFTSPEAIYVAMDANAGAGGGGGGHSGSGSSTGTTSTTTKNPDGSTTVAVTDKATGTVTATTTYPGGAKVVSETTKDGKVSATVTVPSNVKSVTVTIPAEDATDTTVAVIVHPDGTREVVKSSILNETGIAVTLTEGAKLELVDNEKSFSDVSGKQWFADAVAFVTSREIFSGVGGGSFAPDDSMTRAMLWTVLFSLDGGKSGSGVWYADAQKWAMDNGISDGTAPDGSITREQLALIMYNFAKDRGYDMTASRDLSAFTDAGQAADWSVDALKWAVGSGLLSGKGNSVLDPTGGATRAEVAQILMTFMQSLAD